MRDPPLEVTEQMATILVLALRADDDQATMTRLEEFLFETYERAVPGVVPAPDDGDPDEVSPNPMYYLPPEGGPSVGVQGFVVSSVAEAAFAFEPLVDDGVRLSLTILDAPTDARLLVDACRFIRQRAMTRTLPVIALGQRDSAAITELAAMQCQYLGEEIEPSTFRSVAETWVPELSEPSR